MHCGRAELAFGSGPGTRLRLRTEVLAGTVEALLLGPGRPGDRVCRPTRPCPRGIELRPLGDAPFVFVVAPHHPLAEEREPLSDATMREHRGVAVADSAQRMSPVTVNIQPGQDVLTVSSMQTKIEAQMHGPGRGLPARDRSCASTSRPGGSSSRPCSGTARASRCRMAGAARPRRSRSARRRASRCSGG